MERAAKCKLCGEEYIKLNPKQYYCSEKCRCEARRINRANRDLKLSELHKAPALTINDMVKAMLKLSKERGHTVQYGELQSDLLTGRVKVRGGRVV